MIKNGQIWESPSKLLAIAQELASDCWVMLGTPTPVLGGGTAMQVVHFPITVKDGLALRGVSEMFMTREQLERHLAGWKLRADLRLDWL